MKIKTSKYVKSAMRPDQYPRDGRPEFAFVGRSNVGKSSLLNNLLKRKGLAKISNRPGKTQTINFFDINEKIYFVDLPGYGFAKVSKSIKDNWNKAMGYYLKNRSELRMVALLLDARRTPSDKDLHMMEMLDDAEVPTLIVATKIDKLKRSQQKRQVNAMRETLQLDDEALIIPFSSVTGEGNQKVWSVIDDMLGA